MLLVGVGLTFLLRHRPNYLAAVIGLVPILSIYTASYDCIILIIPATVLLRDRAPGWKWLIAAVLISAFIAAPVGRATTLQIQKFVILVLVWFISRPTLSRGVGGLVELTGGPLNSNVVSCNYPGASGTIAVGSGNDGKSIAVFPPRAQVLNFN